MKVGAIDCGTNTVRLLVTDDGEQLVREVSITRLGEGVDASGALAQEAMERTVSAIARYAEQARDLGCDRIAVVATSAARDASNRNAFSDAVDVASGVTPQIIDGGTEASLAFAGATARLRPEGTASVLDIGGGSTEIIEGAASIDRWVSMQLGSVRCAERFSLLGTASERALERADESLLRQVLEEITDWPLLERQLIAVAATATSLAAMDLGLQSYDADRVTGHRLEIGSVVEIRRELAPLEGPDRLKRYPILQPGREDVIVAGASILVAVMRALRVYQVQVSEADILDGIAERLQRDLPIS